jgi:hypothetical protein
MPQRGSRGHFRRPGSLQRRDRTGLTVPCTQEGASGTLVRVRGRSCGFGHIPGLGRPDRGSWASCPMRSGAPGTETAICGHIASTGRTDHRRCSSWWSWAWARSCLPSSLGGVFPVVGRAAFPAVAAAILGFRKPPVTPGAGETVVHASGTQVPGTASPASGVLGHIQRLGAPNAETRPSWGHLGLQSNFFSRCWLSMLLEPHRLTPCPPWLRSGITRPRSR